VWQERRQVKRINDQISCSLPSSLEDPLQRRGGAKRQRSRGAGVGIVSLTTTHPSLAALRDRRRLPLLGGDYCGATAPHEYLSSKDKESNFYETGFPSLSIR
jgi:hypothetical protein